MSIVENIQTQLDNGEFAASVFTDLRKAFDTVDHRILIQKLEHYGVRGISKNWFRQFVSIDNHNSTNQDNFNRCSSRFSSRTTSFSNIHKQPT